MRFAEDKHELRVINDGIVRDVFCTGFLHIQGAILCWRIGHDNRIMMTQVFTTKAFMRKL